MNTLKWRLAAALVVGTSIFSAPVAAEIDKLAAYAQMRAIAAEQQSLRNVPSAQDQYEALQAQFDALKASLGGDDPTLMNESAAGRVGGKGLAGAKVVPVAPAGMTVTTASFTQSTPVAIPTGPGVVTSTVLVSGADTYLWDLDVTTAITHTFAADMDITITSPAGTVVTLTTDNGAGNDNVFNGTVWDDDANPGGVLPYTTNDGMVSDHAYVNLTAASPLVPEEALAGFIGEDPNGTWTITVSDDLAGDGGSIDSFTLAVSTLPSAPALTSVPTVTQSTPVAIPTGPGVVTSTLLVAGAGTTLTDVDLTTAISHTFAADVDMTLTSPAGTVVTLATDNGAGNDNVFNGSVWSDTANPSGQVPYTTNDGLVTDHAYVNLTTATPLVPEEAMGAFLGEDPNGTWTLTISDDLAGDGGSLDSWSLDLETGAAPNAPPVFDYAPTPTSAVNFTGGGAVGSTGNGSIAVSILTPGIGTGAASITTTTCTAPGAPFAGFTEVVTAEGAGAISGGPLTGTCTLGLAPVVQTLTCSEDQGGTPVSRTFELTCPAGTLAPLTSTPASGSTVTLPPQLPSGAATTALIDFQNPNAAPIDVTCVAPAAPFSAAPLLFTVPANGSASTTVSFDSATVGSFTGTLDCTAGNQNFSFNLAGTAIAPNVPVPAIGDAMRNLLILLTLAIGSLAFGFRRRA